MLVSVIMPAFNCQNTVAYSIESIIKQDFANWELIVCDDGSTDATAQIVSEFAQQDPRIRLVYNRRQKGPAGARNTAIEYASGEFLAFLDSDDLWHREKLKVHASAMISNRDINFTASDFFCFAVTSGPPFTRVTAPDFISEDKMRKGNPFGCLAVMLRRAHVIYPLFPEEDWTHDFWGRYVGGRVGHEDSCAWHLYLAKINYNGYQRLPRTLALYRKGTSSLSGNKLKSALKQWLILRRVLKINLAQSAFYFACYGINVIKKTSRDTAGFNSDDFW